MRKIVLIGGLVIGILFSAQAQDPFSRTFSFLDGLPSQTIYHLHAAPNGLLYLGTESGLYTYDGIRFKSIPNLDGVTRPITDLQKDKFGRLWGRNFSGQLFCLINDTLRTFPAIQKDIEKGKSSFEFVVHENGVYVGTPIGFYLYDFNDNHFKLLQSVEEFQENPAPTEGLVYDPGSKVFHLINGREGLIMDEAGNLKKKYLLKGVNKRTAYYNGHILSLSKTNNLIFESFPKQLCDTSRIAQQIGNVVVSYWLELDNQLWISTSTGLHQLSLNTCEVVKSFFTDFRISHATEDDDGNIWVATLDNGLFVIPSLEIIFHSISEIFPKKNMVVSSLLLTKTNEIIAGTTNGDLLLLNPDGSFKKRYSTGFKLPIELLKYNAQEDTYYFNYGSFVLANDDIKISEEYIGKHISWDNKGNKLISSAAFALVINDDIIALPPIFEQYSSSQSETTPFALVLAEGRSRVNYFDTTNQRYYFSTDGGFLYWNGSQKREITLNDKSIVVTAIAKGKEETIWLGTANHGVLALNNDTISKEINLNDGLSGNLVRKLQLDDEGNLYVLTDKGLNFISFEGSSIWNITHNLGLRGVEVNSFELNKNTIILAVNSGIISFPSQVGFQSKIPTIEIIGFNNKGEQIQVSENIRISYKQSELSFKLRSINHKSLGEYTYEYRLLGYEDTWKVLPAQNDVLKFISLPAGNYILEVKSCVNGIYSPTNQIRFTITPPFWKTTIFVLIASLLVLLLIYLIAKFVIIKLRQREDFRVKLALSQITALRAQMSPHFIFNVLNTIQGMIYGGQKSEASDLLGKFSELMRNTLDFSGRKTTVLSKEIEHLKNYIELEKQRFEENDFEFKIQIDKILETDRIEVPSMILQPFVENAIKHGLLHKTGKKKLGIFFQHFEKNTLMVEIEDNGVGREVATRIREKRMGKHQSFATSSIQQRIELMNEIMEKPIRLQVIDKRDSDGGATGTKILIVIPYESNYSG